MADWESALFFLRCNPYSSRTSLACSHYTPLFNNADRKITYTSYHDYCDSGIGPGWFRFEGSAGIRMQTSCQPTNRCWTRITSWINGGHPSVADGQVSRTVFFTGLQVVVNFQQTSKWKIVVLIMCSMLMAYQLMAVIVVLIKNKAQSEYYISTLVHSKWLFSFLVIKIQDGEQN